jgi:poly(A) polymerase
MLRDRGHIAYLAGGCVRDILLGVEPKDFDVATEATPEQIKDYFRKTASVGAAFGVMLVRDFGETIEVATFRSDGVYSDARRPDSVQFSSPEEDAQRRDFTVNALFMDPLAGDEAHTIIDLVCGLSDISDRVLRAVGDPGDRLREDHLRALRAVRFAAKYDLVIERYTKKAIAEHASELSGVSIERIGEELRKMLMHPSRNTACLLIDELGLDDAVFGDRSSYEPRVMSSLPSTVQYPLALAALAIGRGFGVEDDTGSICTHYRKSLDLSNIDRDGMRSILDCLVRFETHWEGYSESARKRLVSREWADGALIILDAMDSKKAAAIHSEIERLRARFGGLNPEPMVDGADLIELGLAPGPAFKAMLDAVYDEQLEGRVLAKPQAIAFVQEQAKRQA